MFLHFNKDLVKTAYLDLFDNSDKFLTIFDKAFELNSFKFRPFLTFHTQRHLWENLFSLQQTLLLIDKTGEFTLCAKKPIDFARTLTMSILFHDCIYLSSFNEQNSTTTIYPGNRHASIQCAFAILHEIDPLNKLCIDKQLLQLCLEEKINYTGTIESTLFQLMFDLSYQVYGVPMMPRYDEKYCYQAITSSLNLELEKILQTVPPHDAVTRLAELELDEAQSEELYDNAINNYSKYMMFDVFIPIKRNLQLSYLIEFPQTNKVVTIYENQSLKVLDSAIKSRTKFSPTQKKSFITKVKNTHLLEYQLTK